MKLEEMTQARPGDRCLICGALPDVIGLFKPQKPETWGAAPGKTRFLRYCLCSKCHEKPDAPERAEKILRAELFGGVTHAE